MWVQVAPSEGTIFRERTCPGMPYDTAVSYGKMAKAIEMPFVLCYMGLHVGAPGEYD